MNIFVFVFLFLKFFQFNDSRYKNPYRPDCKLSPYMCWRFEFSPNTQNSYEEITHDQRPLNHKFNQSLCNCTGNINLRILNRYRILNGSEVSSDVLKFVARIYRKKTSWFDAEFEGICSGSIINPTFVLTAAHCKIQPDQDITYVASGLDHTLNRIYNTMGNFKRVKKFTRHPEFHPLFQRSEHDVGIVELKEPFLFNSETNILPGCFLSSQISDYLDPDFIVAGYGALDSIKIPKGGGKVEHKDLAETLMMIKMNEYKPTNNEEAKKCNDVVLCATSEIGDICSGDSGGPLLFACTDKIAIVGVTSDSIIGEFEDKNGELSRFSCHANSQSFFSLVYKYLDWIKEKFVGDNLCITQI